MFWEQIIMYILGFDIGGTKCAVVTAKVEDENITLGDKLFIVK